MRALSLSELVAKPLLPIEAHAGDSLLGCHLWGIQHQNEILIGAPSQ